MVQANVAHFDALVKDEQFSFEEIDAVEWPASEEIGGTLSAQTERDLVVGLHRFHYF